MCADARTRRRRRRKVHRHHRHRTARRRRPARARTCTVKQSGRAQISAKSCLECATRLRATISTAPARARPPIATLRRTTRHAQPSHTRPAPRSHASARERACRSQFVVTIGSNLATAKRLQIRQPRACVTPTRTLSHGGEAVTPSHLLLERVSGSPSAPVQLDALSLLHRTQKHELDASATHAAAAAAAAAPPPTLRSETLVWGLLSAAVPAPYTYTAHRSALLLSHTRVATHSTV
jgi:hypothetical protein